MLDKRLIVSIVTNAISIPLWETSEPREVDLFALLGRTGAFGSKLDSDASKTTHKNKVRPRRYSYKLYTKIFTKTKYSINLMITTQD